MAGAYLQIRTIQERLGPEAAELRTCAFVNAIDKIAVCYQDLGIFP
jgi:hypothetical protein